MYPECRHIRPSGGICHSPSLKGSHWCYFHARLHERQTTRHSHRRPDGRFLALPASAKDASCRPEPHRASETAEAEGSAVPCQTIDYGPYPVGVSGNMGAPGPSVGTWENTNLDLPPLEDSSAIQLALTDILQALAANQLDTKRAGLLLYGLQVASTNVQKMHIPFDAVRSVTYTDEGVPLAPQDYGYDVEDYENAEDEASEEEESELQ